MKIFVTRDGQQFGPYTLEDVNAYVASGELNATDLAWFDGETNWKPLHELFGLPVPANSPSEQRLNTPAKDADGVSQLTAILKCRTHLRLAVAFLVFGSGVSSYAYGDGHPVRNLVLATSLVSLLVTTYRLAKAIRSSVVWLYCVLLFVPLVNLISLLVLERKASKLLKQGHL